MVDLGGWRGGLQGVTSLTGVHYVARLRGDFREQRGVDRSAQLDPVSLCLSPQASQIHFCRVPVCFGDLNPLPVMSRTLDVVEAAVAAVELAAICVRVAGVRPWFAAPLRTETVSSARVPAGPGYGADSGVLS